MPYPIVRHYRGESPIPPSRYVASKFSRRRNCKYCLKQRVGWKKIDGTLILWDREGDVPHVCDQDEIYKLNARNAMREVERAYRSFMSPHCLEDIEVIVDILEEEYITPVNLSALHPTSFDHPTIPRDHLFQIFSDIKDRLSSISEVDARNNFSSTSVEMMPLELKSIYGRGSTYFQDLETYGLAGYFYFAKVPKTTLPTFLHNKPKYQLFRVRVPKTSCIVLPENRMELDTTGGIIRYEFLDMRYGFSSYSLCNTSLMSLYHEDDEFIYLVGSAESTLGLSVTSSLEDIINSELVQSPPYLAYRYDCDPVLTQCSQIHLSPIPLTAILGPNGGWGLVAITDFAERFRGQLPRVWYRDITGEFPGTSMAYGIDLPFEWREYPSTNFGGIERGADFDEEEEATMTEQVWIP